MLYKAIYCVVADRMSKKQFTWGIKKCKETKAFCVCHMKLIRANTNWTSGGAAVSGQKNKDTQWILTGQDVDNIGC